MSILEVKSVSKSFGGVQANVDISVSVEQPYESGLLKLNCDKALHYLGWQPTLSFPETVRMTAEWYRFYYENSSTIREVTIAHIREYETLFSHQVR